MKKLIIPALALCGVLGLNGQVEAQVSASSGSGTLSVQNGTGEYLVVEVQVNGATAATVVIPPGGTKTWTFPPVPPGTSIVVNYMTLSGSMAGSIDVTAPPPIPIPPEPEPEPDLHDAIEYLKKIFTGGK